MKRKIWTAILSALGMLMLIIDGKTALSGAAEGIELCIRSVIPSLLPFFVLSAMLTSSLWGANLFRGIGQLCAMPPGSESLLIIGLLGGYPVGAQGVADAYRRGALTKSQAERLLGFCSNAGPSFFFGIVASRFSGWWTGLSLWAIHIVSALIVGALLPGKCDSTVKLQQKDTAAITDALNGSLRVMANVCGWVILFRILIAFLQRWVLWMLPDEAKIMLIGLLELANGCCSLDMIDDVRLRFVAASVMLGVGGLCVLMQTLSVTNGLSINTYLLGKLLQGVFSLLLSCGAVYIGPWVPILLTAVLFLLTKLKKYVEIPQSLIYNKKIKATRGGSYAVPKEN